MKRTLLFFLITAGFLCSNGAGAQTVTAEKPVTVGLLRIVRYQTRCGLVLQQVWPSVQPTVGVAQPQSDPAMLAMLNQINSNQQNVANLLQQLLIKPPQADPALMTLVNGFLSKQDAMIAAIQAGNQANQTAWQQFASTQQQMLTLLAQHVNQPSPVPAPVTPVVVTQPSPQPQPTPQPIQPAPIIVLPNQGVTPDRGVIQSLPSSGATIQQLPDGGLLQKLPNGQGFIQTLPSGGVISQVPGLPPAVIIPPPPANPTVIQQTIPGPGTVAPVPGSQPIVPVPGSSGPMQPIPGSSSGSFKRTTTTYPPHK